MVIVTETKIQNLDKSNKKSARHIPKVTRFDMLLLIYFPFGSSLL